MLSLRFDYDREIARANSRVADLTRMDCSTFTLDFDQTVNGIAFVSQESRCSASRHPLFIPFASKSSAVLDTYRRESAPGPLFSGGAPPLTYVLQSQEAMRASNRGARKQTSYEGLPKALPPINLHHGEAIWVLSRLGYQGKATKSTFYEYIKSLRKLGSPFERGKIGRPGGLASYSYFHMMELALVLTLRVYYFVPDSVLSGIIEYRTCLRHHYRRAYSERCAGIGAPVSVKAIGHPPIHVRGLFLDLQINFSGGKLVKFGPPKLLSPFEALTIFAQRDVAARALLPINLSLLSERLVATALSAPLIRRGNRAAIKKH